MIDGLIQTLGFYGKLLRARRYRERVSERAERSVATTEPQLAVTRALITHLDGFVDIGAADGLYLCSVEQAKRPTVAFEPNPRSARLLRRMFPEVTVHQVALSDTSDPRTVSLTVPRTSSGREIRTLGSTVTNPDVGGSVKQVEVSADRLVDHHLPAGRLLVKIDVEGAEMQVLDGAGAAIDQVDCALIECEDRHTPGGPDRLIERMEYLGFDGYILFEGCLVSVDRFDPAVHQSEEATALIGQAEPDPAAMARYGNNFLFVRRSAPHLVAVAQSALKTTGAQA